MLRNTMTQHSMRGKLNCRHLIRLVLMLGVVSGNLLSLDPQQRLHAQTHSIADALGLEHLHGGLRDFQSIRVNDPELRVLRQRLARIKSEHYVWPIKTLAQLENLTHIPTSQLKFVTLAKPWESRGVRPFVTVIQAEPAALRRASAKRRSAVKPAQDTLINDLAFSIIPAEVALLGTADDVQVSLSNRQRVQLASVPDWSEFEESQLFRLSLYSEENPLESQTQGVRISADGITIRIVRIYKSNMSEEWVASSLKSWKPQFERSRALRGADGLTVDQYSYAAFSEKHRQTEEIRFMNLRTDAEWKKACLNVEEYIFGFRFLEGNFFDLSRQRDELTVKNAALQGDRLNERERRLAEAACHASISQLASLMTHETAKLMESVYLQPGCKAVSDGVRSGVHRVYSPEAVILFDKLDRLGDTNLKPMPDDVLAYYAKFGTTRASAAACRIMARQASPKAVPVLEYVARDARREMQTRAAANQALTRLGQTSVRGIDVTELADAPELGKPSLTNNSPTNAGTSSAKAPTKGTRNEVGIPGLCVELRLGDSDRAKIALQGLANQTVQDANRVEVLDALVPWMSDVVLGAEARRLLARWIDVETQQRVLAAFKNNKDHLQVADLHRLLTELKWSGRDGFESVVASSAPLLGLSGEVLHVELFELETVAGLASEEVVPTLKCLDGPAYGRRAYLDALIRSGDPRGLSFIARTAVAASPLAETCQEAIVHFGPPAEAAVLATIPGDKHRRIASFQLLAEIGSSASLRPLSNQLGRLGRFDSELRRECEKAIERITAAKRKRVTLSSREFASYLTRRNIQRVENILQHRESINPGAGAQPRVVMRDGWGRLMRIEPLKVQTDSNPRIEIRSAGPDGRGFTDDDIVELWPTNAPRDLTDAAKLLKSADRSAIRSALVDLVDEAVDENIQAEIVTAALPLLDDPQLDSRAFLVLLKYIGKDDLLQLQAASERFSSVHLRRRETVAYFEQLVEAASSSEASREKMLIAANDAEQERTRSGQAPADTPRPRQAATAATGSNDSTVTKRLNATSARDVLGSAARTNRVRGNDKASGSGRPLADFESWLSDLEDASLPMSSHQAALHHLAAKSIPQSLRARVFKSVAPFVSHEKNTLYVNAFRALEQLGFREEDVPTLLNAYAKQPSQVAPYLASFMNGEIEDFLTSQMRAASRITDPVFRTLETMGAPAERVAWVGLEHEDRGLRNMTLRVLEKIGTQDSIPVLRASDIEPRQLERTLQKIGTR